MRSDGRSADVDLILRRLEQEGRKTSAFFEGLSPNDWDQPVYTTGSRWRVRHLLAHFVSAERAFLDLMRNVAEGGPGAPRRFDIDAFNEREVGPAAAGDTQALLRAFQEVRAASLDLARSLEAEDLGRRGYHPWFGEITLGEMLKLVYRHTMIHLRDARRALKRGRPVPHVEAQPPSKVQPGEG